jgi:DNA-binding MarR family transcriptional regulator
MVSKKSYLKIDDQICFAVYSASLGFNKLYREFLKEFGLTYPQYLVMLVLWETDSLTVSEVGKRMFLNSATLTPLLKRLEKQKLISRNRSTADEREVTITLTKAGLKMKEKAEAIPYRLFCAMKQSPEAIMELREKLKTIRNLLLAKD